MLEGKAKELFNNWLIGWYLKELNIRRPNPLYLFNQQPPSMQWGVIQDFADSLGIYLDVYHRNYSKLKDFGLCIEDEFMGRFPTRQEARDAAIEKLNELLNK